VRGWLLLPLLLFWGEGGRERTKEGATQSVHSPPTPLTPPEQTTQAQKKARSHWVF
jgi:hypothetical protein